MTLFMPLFVSFVQSFVSFVVKKGRVMKFLVCSVLTGLLLFAGCKKKEDSSGAESGKSGEPTVVELQKQLEIELNK
jgi:hypothetical protein